MASVFAAFSRRLPTRYGEADAKDAFDTLFRTLRYRRRRDRTRASASIWHRRWIFIRVQADIRSGALGVKTQISRNAHSQRTTGAWENQRKRNRERVYMLQNDIDVERVHVAKRHSVCDETLIFQTLSVMTNDIRVSTILNHVIRKKTHSGHKYYDFLLEKI